MSRALPLVCLLAAFACDQAPPANEVRASGHVEATDVRLAPEVGGRVVELPLKEGDRVDVDALVVRLDSKETELAIDRANADQQIAEAQLRLLQAGSRP